MENSPFVDDENMLLHRSRFLAVIKTTSLYVKKEQKMALLGVPVSSFFKDFSIIHLVMTNIAMENPPMFNR